MAPPRATRGPWNGAATTRSFRSSTPHHNASRPMSLARTDALRPATQCFGWPGDMLSNAPWSPSAFVKTLSSGARVTAVVLAIRRPFTTTPFRPCAAPPADRGTWRGLPHRAKGSRTARGTHGGRDADAQQSAGRWRKVLACARREDAGLSRTVLAARRRSRWPLGGLCAARA